MTPQQESWNAERSALAADALRRGGRLRLQVRGESMLPSVWPGDTVEIIECRLEDIRPGEIVLALREDRLFLHRFLGRRGEDRFLMRGDAMPDPDPVFSASALQGKLVVVARTGQTVALPVPLRWWSQALGVLFCHWDSARRLALKIHSWRTSRAIPLPASLAKDQQGPQ